MNAICVDDEAQVLKHTVSSCQKIQLLDAYSPLKVMERGYSVVYKGEHVVSSIDEVDEKDRLNVRMRDGLVYTEVIAKEKLHG